MCNTMKCETSDMTPSTSSFGDPEGTEMAFRYEWRVKVCKRRLVGDDELVLNVSPAFSTAFNGVQFTWALRLSGECAAPHHASPPSTSETSAVNVFLYYKDGPMDHVEVIDARVTVVDSNGCALFGELPIDGVLWKKGSGWATDVQEEDIFSRFVHENIGKVITIAIDIRLDGKLFRPMEYLPRLVQDSRLERECQRLLQAIESGKHAVPELDLVKKQQEKFAEHRHILKYAGRYLEQMFAGLAQQYDLNTIDTALAHVYFNEYILPKVGFYDEFIDIIDNINIHHLPTVKRECERYICHAVQADSDPRFVQEMLLLAERFQLPVLKMVAAGSLADLLMQSSAEVKMDAIRDDLRTIARQNRFDDDEEGEDADLVNVIVDELQKLTFRMRRVSVLSVSSSSTDDPADLLLSSTPGLDTNHVRRTIFVE